MLFHNSLTEYMPCLKCKKEEGCEILEAFIEASIDQRKVLSHWAGLTFKCDQFDAENRCQICQGLALTPTEEVYEGKRLMKCLDCGNRQVEAAKVD